MIRFLREDLLFINSRAICFCFCFLLELIFTLKKNQQHTLYFILQSINATPPKVHHELTCCHNCRGMKDKKHIKMKIWLGYVVKAKVGDMEDNIREGRRRRMREEVVRCVQDMVGNNKFLVQFKDGQKKEMSYSSLVFLCSKEEVELDETL